MESPLSRGTSKQVKMSTNPSLHSQADPSSDITPDFETFESLGLHKAILRALSDEGYEAPSDIQVAAIPHVLAGRDIIGTSQTGTGKTAAFAVPILDLLQSRSTSNPGAIRVLVLTPTRELAQQVEGSFRAYGRHLPMRTACLVGGVSMEGQIRALRGKPAIVVATPGRLLDLLQQRELKLNQVEFLVLDEADRMLDMGFIHDVRRIVAEVPAAHRQTLLFSATLSGDIASLSSEMLKTPVHVETTPPASVSLNITQQVYFVEQGNKVSLLAHILKDKDVRRVLVFTRTKHRANRLAIQLARDGVSADAIHSNKSQAARQRALAAFEKGKVTVLVATDIVARGIDVDGISHVINYEMPNDPESYVHRIGRTARAGAAGTAVSFCDATEVLNLKGIEQLTKSPLTRIEDQPFHSPMISSLHGQRPTVAAKPGGRSSGWRSFGPRSRTGRR
jgi:ATP-dependent RNA helicase RhlE